MRVSSAWCGGYRTIEAAARHTDWAGVVNYRFRRVNYNHAGFSSEIAMGCSCCGKQVDVKALQAKQRRVLIVVMAINATTFLMMLAASLHAGSTSLLSGGLDNLGDAATYALSLAVVAASNRAKARVALFKAALILAAAIGVGVQIAWRLMHAGVPLFETMGLFGAINLAANGLCLYLLNPYKSGDVNMSSAWECSRNDVSEGVAVLVAAATVWGFGNGWPDLAIGAMLLFVFLRSSLRIFRSALRELQTSKLEGHAL